MPYITMCQGPKCTANGAGLIIRDMEDLAFGVACVEASGCMGQCSKGPNGMFSEKSGAKGKITNKLNKYSKLTEMLGEVIQGFGLDEQQSRVHKVKFAIRREGNADTRMQAIEETLTSFDDSQKEAHPEMFAEMLCLRAREMTKADPVAAYNDLRDALKLLPDWPWAFVSLAQVLDNLHMPRGALASMQRAIEIGTGVDKNALTRGMVRLQRKADDSKGPDVPPEGIEMDIRYVKEKSLAGEVVQKTEKKGKDKGKKDKDAPPEAQEEDPEKAEKTEKPEKKEKPTKTKDGKEVKASKAKSKVKKDKSGAAKKEAPKEKAEKEPETTVKADVDAAVPPDTAPKKVNEVKSPQVVKSPTVEKEVVPEQKEIVAKSVEVLKDLVTTRKSERTDKELTKSNTKNEKDKTRKHGEKKKKKTKKKKPEKTEHGEYQEWQLRNTEWANHDCVRLSFACKGKPSKNFESSIWHIDLAANLGPDGEEIQRSYTPYSTAEEYKKGILILIVKVYPTGLMSSYLGKMKPGETILVSTPVPTIDPADYPEGAIMVAGGSAVVVALQVITAMLPVLTDSFHLYLCNRKQEDVLLMDEFNALMDAYPQKFQMTNCLSQDKSPDNPQGRSKWSSGRLNADQLKTAPLNLKVLISGPDPLCKMVALSFLELGKQEDDIACLDTDLDDILHPEEKEEDQILLSRQTTQRSVDKKEERPPISDVPRARIKSVKPMVVSIDAIAASSPRISRPPEGLGLGLFSSLFFCGCKSSDALSEGSDDAVLRKT